MSLYQPSLSLGAGPYKTAAALTGVLIPNPGPSDGFVVFVQETNAYYKLSLTSGAPLSSDALATSLGGDSRWLKTNLSVAERPSFHQVKDYLQVEKTPDNGFPPDGINTATSHAVQIPAGIATGAKLVKWSVWSALPADTDSMLVELYLYRRLTEGGPFNYYFAGGTYVFDSSKQWAYEIDITDLLVPDLIWSLNDTLALRLQYAAGGAPSMTNFRVDWTWEPAEFDPGVSPFGAPLPAAWPPVGGP